MLEVTNAPSSCDSSAIARNVCFGIAQAIILRGLKGVERKFLRTIRDQLACVSSISSGQGTGRVVFHNSSLGIPPLALLPFYDSMMVRFLSWRAIKLA